MAKPPSVSPTDTDDPEVGEALSVEDGGVTPDELDGQGARPAPPLPPKTRPPYSTGRLSDGPPPDSMPDIPEGSFIADDFAKPERAARDLGRITGPLSAMGANIRYRVNRLYPSDLPPGEMGWSQWIRLLKSSPTNEDLEADIFTRFGGGEYEIHVRSADAQNPQEDKLTVRLAGPWRWQTIEGQQLFAARYGVQAMQQYAPSAPSGSAPVAHAGPDAAFAFGAQAIQMGLTASQISERESRQRESDQFDRLLRLRALEAGTPKSGAGFGELASILTPILALGQQILSQQADSRRVAEERRMEREDKRDGEFRALLQQMQQGKSQTPQEIVSATQAILEVYKDSTKMELGIKGDVLKAMLMREIGSGTVKPESPLVGMFQDLFREVGPDIVKLMLAKGQAAQASQEAVAATRQPQQQPAPQPQQRRAALPPAPQRGAPPVPLQQGQTVWDAEAAQQQAAEAPAAPVAAPAPEPQVPASAEMGRRTALVSLQACGNVIAILKGFSEAGSRPDPEALWTYVDQSGTQSSFDYLLLAPTSFLDAMKTAEAAPNGVMAFASMVAEVNDPRLTALARDLDAACAADGSRYAYLRSVLGWRPWDAEGGADDDDGGAG